MRYASMLWGNIKGGSGVSPHIGENGNWYIGTTDTGVKAAGTNGVGIASIELISTVGRVKTYRITFTNSATFDFVVTDGADGNNGSQPMQITGLTLVAANWTLVTGLYEYDLANANITANSIVEVIPANASIAIVKSAEVLPETDSSAGSVKLYAINAPTGDISVTINITEKQV